jgi:protein-S-isoprenylcysteine O-methyltransferase Ste14
MTNPVARLIIVLLSTVLFFAPAIAGEGGFDAFFAHPPLIGLTAVMLMMTVVAIFAGGNLSTGVREDRGNRWVLAVFAVLGLLEAYVPAYTDSRDSWTIDGDTVRWAGVVLTGLGGILRIWPVFVLGNRFSGLVAIQPGHTLVTTGFYRWIRNPSYLGLLTILLGWNLSFRSGIGLILGAVMIPPLIARIHSEERLLQSQFGDAYSDYRQRTWRLLPGIY